MRNAVHFYGSVLDNGTVRLRGQITNDDGDLISIGGTEAASYTIYLVAQYDGDDRVAVEGHDDVELTPADCILNTPGEWELDATGYNFQHTIDISESPAFTLVGRTFLVVVSVTPNGEQPRLGAYSITVI